MGNTVKRVTEYLRNPYLVRRIQESFGVKQITVSDPPVPVSQDPKAALTTTGTSTSSDGKSDDVIFANGGLKNGKIDWLSSMPKKRRQLKVPGSRTTSPNPASSPPSSPESDTAPKFPEVLVESHPFLDIYFRIATELGYEPFYITFIPCMFWNVDSYVGHHIVIVWCLSMYVGQACKALFRWSRPASPPAFRLEQNPNLETEFGFPSTHAIVSTVMPFFVVYCCFGRYDFPIWIGMAIAFIWCFSVCTSRIYLGVHSIMDIIGGIIIAVLILALYIPAIDTIDNFVLYSNYFMIALPSLVVFLLYIYPVDPKCWTMDRGDTGAILGSGLGIIMAVSYHGPYPDDLVTGPFTIALPSLLEVWMSLLRFVVGILLLLPTRFIMKLLCFKLLPSIMPTHGVEEVVKRPLVELPYKIITYGAIGFNTVWLAPVVFEICDIARWPHGVAQANACTTDLALCSF